MIDEKVVHIIQYSITCDYCGYSITHNTKKISTIDGWSIINEHESCPSCTRVRGDSSASMNLILAKQQDLQNMLVGGIM